MHYSFKCGENYIRNKGVESLVSLKGHLEAAKLVFFELQTP